MAGVYVQALLLLTRHWEEQAGQGSCAALLSLCEASAFEPSYVDRGFSAGGMGDKEHCLIVCTYLAFML